MEPALLDKPQAATYLGTTVRNIEWLVQSRQIPFVKLGDPRQGKIRFKRDDLDAWIEDNRTEAVN